MRPSRRIRFSLRAALIALSLIAIWGGFHAERSYRERQAEAILRRNHAGVAFGASEASFGVVGRLYRIVVSTIWRERYITRVTISPHINEEMISAIASLPHLEQLRIDILARPRGQMADPRLKEALPDGTIKRLICNHSIRYLAVRGCTLSDADFKFIGAHYTLNWIELSGTNATADSLVPILKLPRLRTLSVIDSNLGDLQIDGSVGSKSLRDLALSDRGCKPAGWLSLARFVSQSPELRVLAVDGPAIDDAFIMQLRNHPHIEDLVTSGNAMTPKCINGILAIPHLRRVAIPDRLLTSSEVNRIKNLRPELDLIFIGSRSDREGDE